MNKEELIKKLAKKSSIIDNFDDIRVVNKELPTLAWTSPKNKEIYINTGTDIVNDSELLANLEGLIIHESGHLDRRLNVPATIEKDEDNREQLTDKQKNLLNFLYDMEIHYQYNVKGRIRPRHQYHLRNLLSLIRTRLVDRGNAGNFMMSMIFPHTGKQYKIRSIVANRNKTIVDKAKELDEFLDDKDRENMKINKGDDSEEGTPQGQQSKEGDEEESDSGKPEEGEEGKSPDEQKGELTKIIPSDEERLGKDDIEEGDGESIKEDIDKQKKINKAKDELNGTSFSDKELEGYIDKRETEQAISNIKNLSDCLDKIIPIEQSVEADKKSENSYSDVKTRFVGYKKLRSMDEIMDNVYDFATFGKIDPDDIDVSKYRKRRNKGVVFVLRDVSGSVSYDPIATYMRDITVSLLRKIKRDKSRVAVIDFHSKAKPIRDDEGNIMTTDYTTLMLDSMKLKRGNSTRLSTALQYMNTVIASESLQDIPLTIYIITDSYVNDCSNIELNSNADMSINGLWLKQGKLKENFRKLIGRYNGTIYRIKRQGEEGLISNLFKEY